MVRNLKPENNKPVVLPLKCGTCVFFKTLKYPKYENTCSNLGILKQNTPCKYYINDARSVSLKTDKGERLSEVIKEFSDKELGVVSSLVKQEKTTRKCGFVLGQTVYVRIYPGEYLSNYAVAHIIQASKDYVFVEGKTRKIRGFLLHSSVFNESQWQKKKALMLKRKAFLDPELRNHVRPKFVEPPEELPKSFVDEDKSL